MNFRSVLMTSAAAVALTTNAWAEQGDTYVSIFGGASEMTETPLVHYIQNLVDNPGIENFVARNVTNTKFVNILLDSQELIKTTTTGGKNYYHTPTGDYFTQFSRTGTLIQNDYRNYTHELTSSLETQGWVIGASVGVELFRNLRAEVEVAFRSFDFQDDAFITRIQYDRTQTRIDAIYHVSVPVQLSTQTVVPTQVGTFVNTLTAPVTTPVDTNITALRFHHYFGTTNAPAIADGHLASFSFMANLWYDIPLGGTGIVPFVGVGIGAANLTIDYDLKQTTAIKTAVVNYVGQVPTSTATSAALTTGTTTQFGTRTVGSNLKTDQAVFAYQFGAGIGYEFDNGVRLSAQYRYFATDDANFGPVTVGVETQDIIAGLTIPFGDGGGRRGRRR